MNKKVPVTIVLGGILLLAIGGLFYVQTSQVSAPEQKEEKETPSLEKDQDTSLEESKTEKEIPSSETAPLKTEEGTSSSQNEVTVDDCENECQKYLQDPTKLDYCRGFCGFDGALYKDKDCMTVSENERDFCFKEEAVQKQDGEICAKIKDTKLKKVCDARVAEDLF